MIARLACSLLLGLSLQWGAWAQGRWHLHPDDQLVWRDVIAHVDNGVVRMGNSWNGEVAFTLEADGMWDETKVFKGFSTSSLDIAFTLRDHKLYLGDSAFSDAILYTFHEGQIFLGDSNFPLDLAYTLRRETRVFGTVAGDAPLWGVYKEGSRARSDRVAVIEGEMDAGAMLALLAAGGLL